MYKDGGRYVGSYTGIVAKNLDDAVYVCAYVVDADDNYHYSGVNAYSVETYAKNAIDKAPNTTKNVAKWMVIYGEMASKCFENNNNQ
jgi:hypothetical protein